MNYSKNVSIVVPTMNRPHFVETMVRVLIKTNFGGSLILCDSSDDENFLRISRIRNTIDDRFQCIHHHLPNMNAGNAAAEIIPEIVTPYAIYLPDDDLPIPRTLEACAMFLDNYPDYSAVTGHTVMANVQNGQICNSGYYYIRPYEQEKPSDRLHALLSDYCVICFSLIRTEYLKDMFLSAPTVTDNYMGNELLINSIEVLKGKVKKLNKLFLVRLNHKDRLSTTDFFDWITNESWSPSAREYLKIISGKLSDVSGTPTAESMEVVKKALWCYINKRSQNHYNSKYQLSANNAIRRWVKKSNKIVHFLRHARAQLPGSQGQFSLEGLSRQSSPYYSDFMPIYLALKSVPAPRQTNF